MTNLEDLKIAMRRAGLCEEEVDKYFIDHEESVEDEDPYVFENGQYFIGNRKTKKN